MASTFWFIRRPAMTTPIIPNMPAGSAHGWRCASMYCAALGRPEPAWSEHAEQQQNDQDDENDANAAARVIAPSAAVRPSRQQTDDKQDQDDQKEKAHRATRAIVPSLS